MEGLEIDGAWWKCKYSPPTFIDMSFTQLSINQETIKLLKNTNCLLFCYFNNRPAFENYMQHYSGNILIIIGPGKEKIVHTDPQPFDNLGLEWRLHSWQEVRNSKDFIAVYCRTSYKII